MPSQGFTQNYSGRIRIEGTEISAEENRFRPGLIVPVHLYLDRVAHSSLDQCMLMDIHAVLFGGAPTVQLSIAERQVIPQSFGRGYEVELKLYFPLDTIKAAEIEKARDTDALLSFKVKPILAGFEPLTVKGPKEEFGQTRHFLMNNFEGPESTFSVNVPQSHWVRAILPRLNVTEYLLVEVPAKTNKKLASAWEHIEKAEAAYLDRSTKAVFAHCREAGDAITTALQQELGDKSFSFIERWGRAHKLFSHLSSLDLHLEEKKRDYPNEAVRIEKADMENVLFVGKSLVRLAEDLLAPKAKEPAPAA